MSELLKDVTDEEAIDLHEILLSIRLIRNNGGWGSTEVELKSGEVDQIRSLILGKPRTKKTSSQKP